MTTPGAAAPPKRFRAECPKCGKVGEHEEFFRERRSITSIQAASRGDFKTMHEYSFRCLACGQRNEKLVDGEGVLHKWQGNRHVVMRV
jgi:hypothetical protein